MSESPTAAPPPTSRLAADSAGLPAAPRHQCGRRGQPLAVDGHRRRRPHRRAGSQPLFLSWQNLLNSLSQSIVIVGLLAVGQTVVIVAGMLDISVGSIASVASVTAASAIVFGAITLPEGFEVPIPFAQGRMVAGILVGILTGMVLGIVNGLVVTRLKVNPIIATLGTLAAFAGLAFLLAPEGKPVGVVTQPDFTWLATGRVLPDLACRTSAAAPGPACPSSSSSSWAWLSSSTCS